MTLIFAILAAASLGINFLGETARPPGPEGISGISRIAGNEYYCVEDRGGNLHRAQIDITPGGVSFKITGTTCLKNRADLEGCAYDPLTHRIWVSDETDTSIRSFNVKTGDEIAAIAVPKEYKKGARRHRSLESLTISPDGLKMYTANEENLSGDPTNTVRIQEFSRAGAKNPFRPSRQFLYKVDPSVGKPFNKQVFSGVSGLTALADGTILVLEREFSVKILPSFRIRIYRITPGKPGKTLEWEASSTFANYEGMCLGPKTGGGKDTLVLVSDGGGAALENVLVLSFSGLQRRP